MAQAATNPKIEELRGRIKSDPKSRLFYPLAEELRKISRFDEAEQVLRGGLANHPTYLSAWVSLGRVLRDVKKNTDAADALNKALQLDPGNVVAARLLGDAYMDLGDKVEAIKKYKLVYALLPGDETLEGVIARLESEINAPPIIPEPDIPGSQPVFERSGIDDVPGMSAPAEPAPFEAAQFEPPPLGRDDGRVFDETNSSRRRRQETRPGTGDNEPMRAEHSESPFEGPGISEGYGPDAFSIEHPGGMHVTTAPAAADPVVGDPAAPAGEADMFEPADSGLAPGFVTTQFPVIEAIPRLDEDDFARIARMADLYAAEGSINEARDIYEDLLARDPDNASLRSKLEALAPPPAQRREEPPEEHLPAPVEPEPATAPPSSTPTRNPKVDKLESWLARVRRGEVGRV